VSNRADLISGGDALVEIVCRAGTDTTSAQVGLNASASNLLSRFATGATRGWHGPRERRQRADGERSGDRGADHHHNHPITGPIISGPHITPYECRWTRTTSPPGATPTARRGTKCGTSTRPGTALSGRSPPTGKRPRDLIKTTTSDGNTVPYIVRVMSGTINRGVYRLAMLDNPGVSPLPGAGMEQEARGRLRLLRRGQYNQGAQDVTLGPVATGDLLARIRLPDFPRVVEQPAREPAPAGRDADDAQEAFIEHIGIPKWTVASAARAAAISNT